MKHIHLGSILCGIFMLSATSYTNATYVDWDCQSRDSIEQMNVFIDEKTKSLNDVITARKNYQQTEIDSIINELQSLKILVSLYADDAYKMSITVSPMNITNASTPNLERINELISSINKKIENQPKWDFDALSYNNRITIRNACIKKFADIDKQKAIELEIQQKSEESNRLQEIERAKINAAAQKEQEEAAIRALTKKKLELELEMLSKQKLEQISTAPTIQETSSNSSGSVANIDEMASEFQLLKTTREKNAFIGKRIVALKRELRKAEKVRVKEIINEMRKLKELQK